MTITAPRTKTCSCCGGSCIVEHTTYRKRTECFCSRDCVESHFTIKYTIETAKPFNPDIPDLPCRCGLCPHDIREVFPGKKRIYENGFHGTACPWHWMIEGQYGTVQIDGPGLLYVEVHTSRLKSHEKDWQDTEIIRSEGAGQANEILRGVRWCSSFRVPITEARKVSRLLKLKKG